MMSAQQIEIEARKMGWSKVPTCKCFVVGDDDKLHCMHDCPPKYNPDIVMNVAENCKLCAPDNCHRRIYRWARRDRRT